MRINLNNASAGELPSELTAQQTTGAKSTGSVATPATEDRATLSSDTTSLKSLVSTALSTPPVRQSTVDSLKQAVSSGTYELNPSKIAASMVDEYA